MEAVSAIFFDLDGVLIDSKEAWFQVVVSAARHFCKPDVDRKRFDAGWGQGVDADLRDFFPGCSHEDVAAFYEKHLLDHGDGITIKPGARDAFIRLRDANILRGVITNTSTPLARDLLAWAGLIGLVDFTSGADADVPPKPAPDTILRACTELGIEPGEVLVVGDSRFDEEAARAAKVAGFIGFDYPSARTVQSLSEVVRLVVP